MIALMLLNFLVIYIHIQDKDKLIYIIYYILDRKII